MKHGLICLYFFSEALPASASICGGSKSVEFIVQKGDALLAAIEDDVRADLAKVDINVVTRFLEKDDFNSNMTSGNFNLCFSETWGPPYDPHSYASSWKSPDEAHFAALKGMQAPKTQSQLTADITNVLIEEDLQMRQQKWKGILTALHEQAIDLPFSGKRMPTVLSTRLTGYLPGQQQFDYPVHSLQVLSGSKTITIAPGGQTGLFQSVGRMDPHTYRPNEFFANNWVYESLVSYGVGGVIEPALASSWTAADKLGGGQEYRFMLRQGVTFHDGSAWNCAAAKLNFDHVLAKPLTTGDWHGWYDLPKQIQTWSCAGTYEFVVTTKDKYYPLLQELTYIRPLRMLSPAKFASGSTTDPKTQNSCHAGWGSITGNGETITCAGITGASGTGPFRYIETLSNGDAKFERNAAHWRSAPQVETIILKKYADSSQVMAALLAGSLDAVMGAGVLKPVDLKTIQTQHSSNFQVFLGPPIMNRVIIMNANKAPTDDLTLRKVIMHAVNKAAIIDKELYGLAEPVDALFPKNAPYCHLDLTPRWDYDFEKATLLRCREFEAVQKLEKQRELERVKQEAKSSKEVLDKELQVLRDASGTAPAQQPTSSNDSNGVDAGIVIAIVAAILFVGIVAGIALFAFGRRKGVKEGQLLQSSSRAQPAIDQSEQQDSAAVLGNPDTKANGNGTVTEEAQEDSV